MSRSSVQQGVYRKKTRLDLEYQAATGAHGIPPRQGLQAKRQVRAAVSCHKSKLRLKRVVGSGVISIVFDALIVLL